MNNPYDVVKQFESALCDYTGAKYAVTVTSCTAALLLAVKYAKDHSMVSGQWHVGIPNRTYVSVPMSIINAGATPYFIDSTWIGEYNLIGTNVWDCARWFRKDMYRAGKMMCLSFHWTKQLAIGQGGCILHDNDEADEWLRRARFDGRKEGVAPKDDTFTMIGHHCYLSPRDAAEGISRLAVFKDTGQPLPNDQYPDLSQLEIFK